MCASEWDTTKDVEEEEEAEKCEGNEAMAMHNETGGMQAMNR